MPDAAPGAGCGRLHHVVFVGAMGSGKSTIGRSVAAALERRFVDNDEQVLAATGMTAAVSGMSCAESGAASTACAERIQRSTGLRNWTR